MPDRVLRGAILTSESVDALSFGGEVFYRRLMSVVDDFGRYDARAKVLLAALYPLKIGDVSLGDVNGWLEECMTAGLVTLYRVNGAPYLQIEKFNQRVRQMKSRWPGPDGAEPDDDEEEDGDVENEGLSDTPAVNSPQPAVNCQQSAVNGQQLAANRCPETETESETEILKTTRARVKAPPNPPGELSAKAQLAAVVSCCELSIRTMDERDVFRLSADVEALRGTAIDFSLLPAFRRWWDEADWRGKKGQPPTIRHIRETWGQFERHHEKQSKVLQMAARPKYCGKCDHGYIPSGVTGGRALRCECVTRPRMEATA